MHAVHGFSGTLQVEDPLVPATEPQESGLTGDFNGDGEVDFADFFLFADHFGLTEDENWDSRYDLDDSGEVGFADFFLFADSFGR
jgi:hypothetical protein